MSAANFFVKAVVSVRYAELGPLGTSTAIKDASREYRRTVAYAEQSTWRRRRHPVDGPVLVPGVKSCITAQPSINRLWKSSRPIIHYPNNTFPMRLDGSPFEGGLLSRSLQRGVRLSARPWFPASSELLHVGVEHRRDEER